MKTFLSIFIFCIVLFLYIHIHFHLKTSDDLEVYEIESPTKPSLEDICDIRQPVTFSLQNEQILNICNKQSILDKYGTFEINMRNVTREINTNDCTSLHMPIQLHNGLRIVKEDNNSTYISENNQDFLKETGLSKILRVNDLLLRPYMVCKTIYDILFGSKLSSTPLKYNINYRNFFYVSEGAVKVKLIPPRSSKYLYAEKDYFNFEFRSNINPWNVQEKYKNNYSKAQTLEVEIKKGEMLFVPAYWWYSIQFLDSSTTVVSMQYRTYMNVIATLPYFAMCVLQRQNTKLDLSQLTKSVLS